MRQDHHVGNYCSLALYCRQLTLGLLAYWAIIFESPKFQGSGMLKNKLCKDSVFEVAAVIVGRLWVQCTSWTRGFAQASDVQYLRA